MFSPLDLTDSYGRRIRKLRVSLLDACNLRCLYCMPEKPQFMSSEQYLKTPRLLEIVSILVEFGLKELRITGGEPTLRREFLNIVQELGKLPIQKLGLTSNGVLLERFLPSLKDAGLSSINISLDSLDSENFKRITKRDLLPTVLRTIDAAQDQGFQVKINAVMMGGINDQELFDFIDFSAKNGLEVRFLELMKIGQAVSGPVSGHLIPSADLVDQILTKYALHRVPTPSDSTAKVYDVSSGARIGFISSETEPFCQDCSRWRLTASGFLRACLMKTEGVDLRDAPINRYPKLLAQVLNMKPIGRIEKVEQDMNQIGG